MKRWLKVELHAHTREDPWDGDQILHSAECLIEEAVRQGFQALSITNHDQMLFGRRLEQFANERGIVLIPGVEATLGGKHVLLYNFPDYNPSWKDFKIVARHKGEEQMVLAPHPFYPMPTALGRQLLEWQHLFDGIEYSHFYLSWLNFNRRAERIAGQLKVPLLGTSDAHHLFQLGRTYTLVHAEHSADSVISAIKAGEVQLVTQPLGPLLMGRWLAMASWWSLSRRATTIWPGRTPGMDGASTGIFANPSGTPGAPNHS